jgi:SAM-dependent methyltransferase
VVGTQVEKSGKILLKGVDRLKQIECPLCGQTTGETVLRITRPDRFERAAGISDVDYHREWLACLGCGLLIDCYNRKDISYLYDDQYYSAEIEKESVSERFSRILAIAPEKSDNHYRVKRILSYLADFYSTYSNVIPADLKKRILDIGSGTGIFLYRFLEYAPDWNASAVEPNHFACEHLRALEKFKVIEKYFAKSVVEESQDFITLNKVIEHIQNPVELLKNVKECLSNYGLIYVEVPDRETARYREPDDNILGSLHFYLFDPATLCLLFQKSQLVPLTVQRYVEPSGKITVSGFAVAENFFRQLCGT